jgi:hypothetical protein
MFHRFPSWPPPVALMRGAWLADWERGDMAAVLPLSRDAFGRRAPPVPVWSPPAALMRGVRIADWERGGAAAVILSAALVA